VVVDDPEEECTPIAVITDRDLVVEVLGNGLDPATTMLGALVYRPLVIANESEDISEAVARMRTHGIRRIPVVNAGGRVVPARELLHRLGIDRRRVERRERVVVHVGPGLFESGQVLDRRSDP